MLGRAALLKDRGPDERDELEPLALLSRLPSHRRAPTADMPAIEDDAPPSHATGLSAREIMQAIASARPPTEMQVLAVDLLGRPVAKRHAR